MGAPTFRGYDEVQTGVGVQLAATYPDKSVRKPSQPERTSFFDGSKILMPVANSRGIARE